MIGDFAQRPSGPRQPFTSATPDSALEALANSISTDPPPRTTVQRTPLASAMANDKPPIL